MKLKTLLIVCIMNLLPSLALAQHPANHAKHNMIMLGTQEIFLSHLVYKVPHHYQVILKIELNEMARNTYLKTRQQYPNNLMIMLLDHMDIAQIREVEGISGTIYLEDSEGKRTEILTGVKLARSNYQVVYLDEVPLDLSGK